MKPPQQDRNGRELWPAARRVPSLMALAGLVALGLLQSAPPPAHAAKALGPPLVEPVALHSQNGVLDTTLVEKPGVAQVAGIPVQNVWTYQLGEDGAPNYPGPTLYVQPGDTLRLRIVNRLPPSLPPAAIDLVPDKVPEFAGTRPNRKLAGWEVRACQKRLGCRRIGKPLNQFI